MVAMLVFTASLRVPVAIMVTLSPGCGFKGSQVRLVILDMFAEVPQSTQVMVQVLELHIVTNVSRQN